MSWRPNGRPNAANALKEYLLELQQRSIQAIDDGSTTNSQERFCQRSCQSRSMWFENTLGTIPVRQALLNVLTTEEKLEEKKNNEDKDYNNKLYGSSLVRRVVEGVFDAYHTSSSIKYGKYASLWELNCFMSNAGARRQLSMPIMFVWNLYWDCMSTKRKMIRFCWNALLPFKILIYHYGTYHMDAKITYHWCPPSQAVLGAPPPTQGFVSNFWS